jgi:transposase
LSREGVSQVVKGFNQRGLDILSIATGRGRKLTYTSQQQTRILAELQREPDRKADQTATWSRMTLRAALRKTDLPEIAAETIRQVLHEAGYSYNARAAGSGPATLCASARAARSRPMTPRRAAQKRLIEQAYE